MRWLPEIRYLALVVAIGDEGSLVGAAKRLHLTPSALSQQLRELERRLGGALFSRGWRRLVPTAAGQRFMGGARAVIDEITRLEEETRRMLDGAASASLRFTTVCQQSYRWLPGLLEVFGAAHPDVEVNLVSEAAGDPADWLLRRKLDAALVAGELAEHPKLRIAPLFRDELVAVVGRRHRWFGQRRVLAAAFAHEHLFTDAGALRLNAPLGRALADADDVAPRKVTLVPMNGTVAVDMARANLGVTLLPRWTVESFGDDQIGTVRVGRGGLWLSWAVATRAEEPDAAMRLFLAALRASHPRVKLKRR